MGTNILTADALEEVEREGHAKLLVHADGFAQVFNFSQPHSLLSRLEPSSPTVRCFLNTNIIS